MSGPRVVLVPLDGGAAATAALPVARAMAELEGASLRVVFAADRALPAKEIASRLRAAESLLGGAALIGMAGDPADALVRVATETRETTLIVLSTGGAIGGAASPGQLASSVLRASRCPVLLVSPERGLAPWSPRRVLLPLDGTPSAAMAVGPSCALAERAGAELLVLHVADPSAARPVETGSLAAPVYVDQAHHEWKAWGRELLERILYQCGLPNRERVHLYLAAGEAGIEIPRFALAHSIDLVLASWRGQVDEGRAATLMRLLRDAPCPVLVSRSDGSE